ncbi:MAG TPA: hypothetical protein VG819_08235 [Rhizomicrobium sp.]|jgi:hypothetical protein|nr:hypothetical protein [Rhizomicrobium sp.]
MRHGEESALELAHKEEIRRRKASEAEMLNSIFDKGFYTPAGVAVRNGGYWLRLKDPAGRYAVAIPITSAQAERIAAMEEAAEVAYPPSRFTPKYR